VIVALKESERKGRAGAILSYFKDTQDPSLKASVYRVLGPIGDPDSLEVLRTALKDSNPALREAAFRGLAEWPGPDVTEDMKRFIKQGENETIRVIAFRAYVRMVRQSDLATELKVTALAAAMSMAPRESENKAVLAALGEQPSEQALTITVKNLENTELKAEAQAAVLGICEKMIEKQPGMCRTALTKLLESSPNEAITNRAKDILNTIK
jgi:HEAT repeat protein